MCNAVRYQKTLFLLVDHTNFLKSIRDDVIINGCPPQASLLDIFTVGGAGGGRNFGTRDLRDLVKSNADEF
jgi:hypothetical protein